MSSIISKSDICFIRPKIDNNDYYYKGIKKMGYLIYVPYKEKGIIFRILRELWFRFGLPKPSIWYNQEINTIDPDVFVVRDSLITNDFLIWLRDHHARSRIILDYDNTVDTTLNPDAIQDKTIEKWSYDADDCKKYGMKMKPQSFLDVYRLDGKKTAEYDVLYLGRDKGRLDSLIAIEDELKNLGLTTCFHICADRKYQLLQNKHYKRLITYESYLELMKKSKAILNFVVKPQKSMTMRDMEVVFNGIKGITNNIYAADFPLYDPSRFFILGVDPIDSLVEFLDEPFLPLSDAELEPYRYENAINQMIDQ